MSIEMKVYPEIVVPIKGDDSASIRYLDDDCIKIYQCYEEDKTLGVCFTINEIDSVIESLLFAKKIFTSHE
mgnify:CR=1 FL=1